MADEKSSEIIKLTESQLQDLVTQVMSSVNTRIEERLVSEIAPGDTKHIPTSSAVQGAIPTSLPANGGNADTATGLLPVINVVCNANGAKYTKLLEVPTDGRILCTHTFVYQCGNVDGAVDDYGILHIRIDINSSGNRFARCTINRMTEGQTVFDSFFFGVSESSVALFIYWTTSWDYVTLTHVNSFGNFPDIPETFEFLSEIPVEYEKQEPVYLSIADYKTELADLKAYIGYTDSDIYGIEADFENNKFTRLAGAAGKNPGSDFDNIRAFGGRKRCNLADDGTVLAYYGENNYEEDGYVGVYERAIQTMVEQPKFYYKVIPLKTEKIDGADGYHLRKARYYISDTPKPGFKVHPAFIQNGNEVDKIYLSAYEGCLRDVSAMHHIMNDEQVADFDNDMLASIANAKPASGTTQALTRANALKLAQNRGAGWGITTIQTLSATQLLFAIEYATFNSQAAIGNGVVNATETIRTGSTSSLGNGSGSVESGGVSYRGEENLWGNQDCWIDNFEIESNKYKTNNTLTSYGCPLSQGWINGFGYDRDLDYLFLPSSIGGSSALPIGDMLVANSNITDKSPHGSGNNVDVTRPGMFYLSIIHTKEFYNLHSGCRLIYIPQPAETTQEVTE